MKFLLVISLFFFDKLSVYAQSYSAITVDTIVIRGAIVESRYSKLLKENNKRIRFFDSPTYYVLLDSNVANKKNFLRSSLNQHRMGNDSLGLLKSDKDFVSLNHELFNDTLIKEGHENKLFLNNSSIKYSRFNDAPEYWYRLYKGDLKCLRFKLSKKMLLEKDILSRYSFKSEYIYFFIVFDGKYK